MEILKLRKMASVVKPSGGTWLHIQQGNHFISLALTNLVCPGEAMQNNHIHQISCIQGF